MSELISRQKLIEELEESRSHMIPKSDGRHSVSIETVIDYISKFPTADQWIPCSSGVLPTERGTYWVTEDWGDGNTAFVRYSPKLHGTFEDYMEYYGMDITAWMPATLPEPYKEVK